MKLKFSNDFELVRKYDALNVKGLELKPISDYGLDELWYGGNLIFVGTVKDSPILVMIGKMMRTLAVAVDETRIKELSFPEQLAFGVVYVGSLLGKETTTEVDSDEKTGTTQVKSETKPVVSKPRPPRKR